MKQGILKQAMNCPFSDDHKRGIIFGGTEALRRVGLLGHCEDLKMALEIAEELGLVEG